MKRFYFPAFLLVVVSLLTVSCEKAEEAVKYADKFHGHMKKGEEAEMIDMIHPDSWEADSTDWKTLVYSLDRLGPVKKIEKEPGFNSEMSNGVSMVTLNYTIEFEDRTMKEEIVLQDAGDGTMKVIRLHLN